jgi:hypothetical protein
MALTVPAIVIFPLATSRSTPPPRPAVLGLE